MGIHLKLLGFIVSLIGVYYLNTRFLVPKLLFQKKNFLYVTSVLTVLIMSWFLNYQISVWTHFNQSFFQVEETVYPEDYDQEDMEEYEEDYIEDEDVLVAITFLAIFYGTLISSLSRQRKIEHEKASSEIALLKKQISPHFLFNTLNNVYSMIKIDPEMARDHTYKLSKLLRYTLNESESKLVSVEREVDFISNYIAIEKIRLNDSIKVNYNVQGNFIGQIPPLLLIAFIENAFKHGTSYVSDYSIDISIKQTQNRLFLYVSNPITEGKKEIDKSGIGLANVNKRLELIYQESDYQLSVVKNDRFIVELEIPVYA